MSTIIEYYEKLLVCSCEGFVIRSGPKQNWSITDKVTSFFDGHQDMIGHIIQPALTLGANDIMDAVCLYLRGKIDALTNDEITRGC